MTDEPQVASTPSPVLVIGAPARDRRARIALGAAALAAGIAAAVVALVGSFHDAPVPAAPLRAAAAVVPVQRFSAGDEVVLKAPKRDRFTAVAPEQVEGAASAAGVVLGPVVPVGDAQRYAAAAVAGRGWSKGDFACLVSLWNRESGWNTHAGSPGGAYGIPQALPGSKMAAAGSDWVNSAQTQIDWGLSYIAGHYGSPCGAWSHWESAGYY